MLRTCSLLVLLATPAAADFWGRIRVIDGDTFDVGSARVRLHGIDAPEADQVCGGRGAPAWACGAWVTDTVRARYEGRHATCVPVERDRHGRIVARCAVSGVDIGRALVADGLAFAYRRYSMDYDLDEKGAAVRGAGLHGTEFQTPEAYRDDRRALRAVPETVAGCVIKGNVSAAGDRIYHMPGQRHYAETVISERKGERMFCSEAEARAAGWRRARR